MPYALPPGSGPDTTGVQLRVDTPRLFTLTTPFWYAPARPLPPALDAALPPTPPDAPDGAQRWLSISEAGTDLGTVPGVLWGLIASYGRHTLAVLVHDRLCDTVEDAPAEQRFVRQAAADEVFHQALRDPYRSDFRAPWFRSAVVWAGVSAARYWRYRRAGFAALAAATAGAWVAGVWLGQSVAGPAQGLAAWVLLCVASVVLLVAGLAQNRVRSAALVGGVWIVRAMVVGVVLLLLWAAWASTPWPPWWGFAVPDWLGVVGLVAYLAGSAVLALSPVRRDVLLPTLTAIAGPWVALVAVVTVGALHLLWIPDAFSGVSGGPINTVEASRRRS